MAQTRYSCFRPSTARITLEDIELSVYLSSGSELLSWSWLSSVSAVLSGYCESTLPFLKPPLAVANEGSTTFHFYSGEDRQLLPWELAAPTVTSGSIVPMSSPRPSSPSDGSWDDESSIGYPDEKSSPDNSFRTQTSATPYPWEKNEATLDGVAPAEHTISFTPDSSRPPSYKSGGSVSKGVVPESARMFPLNHSSMKSRFSY